VRAYGNRAVQIVVDQTVIAVKWGDDAYVTARDKVLRAIERRLDQELVARRFGSETAT